MIVGDRAEPRERRDAAEHRQLILVTARRLFETQGVDATSMMEIAREAGVGQGTLYRRFAHKGELCLALLKDDNARLQAETEAAFASLPRAGALELVKVFFDQLLRFNEQNRSLLAAIIDSNHGPRRSGFFMSDYYTWLHTTITRLLEKGTAEGEMAPLDTEIVAHIMFTPLNIDLYWYLRDHLGYSQDRIRQSLERLLIDGLRAR